MEEEWKVYIKGVQGRGDEVKRSLYDSSNKKWTIKIW